MVYALRIYSEEDTDRGLTLLAEAAMADPEDTRISLTLAKLLLREQRHRQACELLSALPKEKRELADVRDLLAHIDFVVTAQAAPDKHTLQQTIKADDANLEARYQLSVLKLVE